MVCSFPFRVLVFALCGVLMAAAPTPTLAQANPIATTCANPNQDAHVVSAVNPELPQSAHLRGSTMVLVEVSIRSNGLLKTSTIYKSSGNVAIDDAALKAARASIYAPKIVQCVPTEADYLFRMDFRGTPLAPPTIAVPPGWQPGRFNGKSQYATLSWSDVPQHQLILRWQASAMNIDDVRKTGLYGALPAQRIEDVRLCNGTQAGLRSFHETNGSEDRSPAAVMEVLVANGVLYTAAFLAYDHQPPGAAVQKALDSFCAPVAP